MYGPGSAGSSGRGAGTASVGGAASSPSSYGETFGPFLPVPSAGVGESSPASPSARTCAPPPTMSSNSPRSVRANASSASYESISPVAWAGFERRPPWSRRDALSLSLPLPRSSVRCSGMSSESSPPRSNRSRTRGHTSRTGVRVAIRTPETRTRLRTTIAKGAVTSFASDVPAMKPSTPPAAWTPSRPWSGRGWPAPMWMMPATAQATRKTPMTMPVVSCGASGWRSMRMTRRSRRTGRPTASTPNVPATSQRVKSPSGLAQPHHSRAATTTASASHMSAATDCRTLGSTPRTPSPTLRAPPPRACDRPTNPLRTMRSGQGARFFLRVGILRVRWVVVRRTGLR